MSFAIAGIASLVYHSGESSDYGRYLIDLVGYLVGISFIGVIALLLLTWREQGALSIEISLARLLASLNLLNESDDWGTIAQKVVEFPRAILPLQASHLYIYNPGPGAYEPAAYWAANRSCAIGQSLFDRLSTCTACPIVPNPRIHPVPQPPGSGQSPGEFPFQRYCLPLTVGGRPVGLLHLDLRSNAALSQDQADILNTLAPLIGLVIERVWLLDRVKSHSAVAEAERRHIAQELHDSLGQNIAYLRLKLDQILYQQDSLEHIASIQDELERMRETADEAYHQVRETLADLHPDNSKEFIRVLSDHARMIASRAPFQLEMSQEGTPFELRPHIQRQVLYICREALGNIEKHAGASHVHVAVNWRPDALLIEMQDDGVGFEVESVDSQSHFGLGIMRERARNIQADFSVESQPGRGTLVSLCVPIGESSDLRTAFRLRQDLTIPIFRPSAK